MLSGRRSSKAPETRNKGQDDDDDVDDFQAAHRWRGRCARRGLGRHAQADAQAYPTRAITVIIPFAGGSASDVVARILFQQMSKDLGQPIIVENRPGAGGNSGTLQGARSRRPMDTR